MTSAPAVSVVMPVLNPHPVHFREAVASVLAQTRTDLELVIVEDPSPASGQEILRRLADPRIVHQCNASRTGLVSQRNHGLALARAPWVAMLDADDVCEPQRLEKQLAYLDAHPHIDVLGSQLTIIDELGHRQGFRAYPENHATIAAAMKRFNTIANSTAICRTQTIRDIGGYQYRGRSCEDYDLWSRLLTGGAVFANHPESLVRYRIHTGQLKQDRLRDHLRDTLDIKRRYWRPHFNLGDRVRFWAEHLLLLLPPALVLQLFQAIAYRRGRPPGD